MGRPLLYVEDDDATAYLFKRAVAECIPSLEIFRVKDTKDALAFLMRQGIYHDASPPSLLVLDLNVPDWSGFEVLKALQTEKALHSVPAVVLSGSLDPSDRQRASQLGARKFFLKSDDWSGFVATAREICSMLRES
jgi:CheY-like chemotaxis protein